MDKSKELEILQGIQLVRQLRLNAVKAQKPASLYVRAETNLNDYFAKKDYNKCLEILEQVSL